MFDGKVAVVTGGARGIGLATVKRLLAGGASVSVWDLESTDEFEELARTHEGRTQFNEVDVRNYNAARIAASRCDKALGGIDILINNAGVTLGYVGLDDTTPEVLATIIGTNVEGTVNATRAVLPQFRRVKAGRIVNCASLLARVGFPGQTAYAASKSAIEGVTRVWARELGPIGVTVNAVSPGYIATRMNETNPETVDEYVRGRTPLGRIGTADEVAAVAAFLASDDASYITGVIVPVDGGYVP